VYITSTRDSSEARERSICARGSLAFGLAGSEEEENVAQLEVELTALLPTDKIQHRESYDS
jgi:hypothetical protein